MNLLRANVRKSERWWELALLDLNIVADGETEDAMLRDVEHCLIAEYHLAVVAGETPFVRLFKGCPPEVSEAWKDGEKNLRTLNLTPEVRMALAAVFRRPLLAEFQIKPTAA